MAPTVVDVCASCDKYSTSLLNCGSCHSVKYCDRDCQRSHWNSHKAACREALKASVRDIGNNIRQDEEDSRPVVTLSQVHGEAVPKNFHLKQDANAALLMDAATANGKIGVYKKEAVYRAYYDDLVADKATWMAMFEEKDNFQHAEQTCGILGTLATLYRVGDDLEMCEKVLDMENEVLMMYQRATQGKEDAQQECCDELTYKYLIIRYNLHFQKKEYNTCIGIYRELLAHELKYDYDFEAQNFLFMIQMVVNKEPSKKVLDSLSDRDILKLVKAPLSMT